MPGPRLGQALWEALRALQDPKAPPALRLRGLRLYAGFLLSLQGLLLLFLAWVLPRAAHPFLWALALGGGAWLLAQAQGTLAQEEPLAPLVAVGLGAALFFFLGVMGLLLWPGGSLLWGLGMAGFAYLWRRAALALTQGG
ncbi:hypothetical protein [Thermus altitudinis]|uniref:hypothetical protein n=1 Tax=Thermus altitudinis TaxID=2908145 RepID=UPI001FAA54E1|nr:hypothetical protein [Thermus altitudinis]